LMAVILKEEVAMSVKENKAIVRRFYEEFYNKRNEAVPDELISPDYRIWSAGREWVALPTRGQQCIRMFVVGWWGGFPDLSFAIQDMVAEGDRVVSVDLVHATHTGDFPWGPGGKPIKATGKPVTLVDVIVTRLAGGKIVEEWQSVNWASLYWQLGAI
jgi:predicted ester cyclase